jgi:hypothetical protein
MFSAMRDELVKIAKMRHEEQRYAEHALGLGRGNASQATPAQERKAKRVMGGLRSFLGSVSSQAKSKGMLSSMPREMHIPIGGGHTAMVERMKHGLVAKTVYDSSYSTKDKPVMTRRQVSGLLRA